MQGHVTSTEQISAISPHTVDPWERHLWVPVYVDREYHIIERDYYLGYSIDDQGAGSSKVVLGEDAGDKSSTYDTAGNVFRVEVGPVGSEAVYKYTIRSSATYDGTRTHIPIDEDPKDTIDETKEIRVYEGELGTFDGPKEQAPLKHIEYEETVFDLPFRSEDTRSCPSSGDPMEVSRVKEVPCVKETVGENDDYLDKRTYTESGSVDKSGDFWYDSVTGELHFSNAYSGTETVQAGYEMVEKTDENGDVVYEQVPEYDMVPDLTEEGYQKRDEDGNLKLKKGGILGWNDGDPIMVEGDPIEVQRPSFDVESGTYWIPRLKVESDFLWDITAKGVGFEREMRPSEYTPEHWPYLLQLFEWGLQRGAEDFALRSVLSGLGGNPFAYADGRIISKEKGDDRDYVVIHPDDPADAPDGQDVLYCEAPKGKGLFLKRNGTRVRKFETLVREDPVTITYNREGSDTTWSDPLEIRRLDENTFQVISDGDTEGFRLFLNQALQYASPNLSDWSGVERGYYAVEKVDDQGAGRSAVLLSPREDDETAVYSEVGNSFRLEVGPETKEDIYTFTVRSKATYDGTQTRIPIEENPPDEIDNTVNIRAHKTEKETQVWGQEAEWEDAEWFWLDINQIVLSFAGQGVRIRNITQGTEQFATMRRVKMVDNYPDYNAITADNEEKRIFLNDGTDPEEEETPIGYKFTVEGYTILRIGHGSGRFREAFLVKGATESEINTGTVTIDGKDFHVYPDESTEASSNYGVVVDKLIPQREENDVLVIQTVTDPPQNGTDITIDIENLPYNGMEASIKTFVEEALPRGVRFDVNLKQEWWKTMPEDWGFYRPTWSGEDCPQEILIWQDPYDSSQTDSWDWAEENSDEADEETWHFQETEWG